ncbi:MAG: hypothetical protein IPK19_06930 [Chloroflexi bacterium]|nr:hypothetical protein [Chloroflexota bacterium]
MNMQAAPPQLGSYILVVIDSSPGFFDALQTAVSRLPDIDRTFFTVLCCCPTRYWGHVGDSTPELKRYIDSLLEEEEAEFAQAEHCLGRARTILEDAGAPSDQILTRTSAEDSLLSATMDELKKSQYSGLSSVSHSTTS